MSDSPVIDACALVYDDDCWRAYLLRLADHAPQYLHVFAESLSHYFGADLESYRHRLRTRGPARAVDVLLHPRRIPFDLDRHLDEKVAQGVVGEVAMGGPAQLADGTTMNDRVASFAAAAPGRIHAWAGLSLRGDPTAAVAELKHCLDLGMTGLSIIPFLDGVDVTDPRFSAIFELAAAERLPLWLHSGHHFAVTQPLDISSWRQLDLLAGRYPEISIVAGHAGWPWVLETISVASRHDNVFLEISSHRAKHMSARGSGWEPLLRFGPSSMRNKVLFGTSTWVNPVPVKTLAEEVRALDFGGEVTADWLYGNAERMLARR